MSNEPGILKAEYLILVAVVSEENKLLEQALLLGLNCKLIEGKFGKYHYITNSKGLRLVAVRSKMGPFAYEGSASKAIYFKSECQATCIICLGMAFGVSDKYQQIGDVLISTSLLPYDDRDVNEVKHQVIVDYNRVRPYDASESILRLLQKHAETDEWKSRTRFGAILTGAARIHTSLYRDELVKNCTRNAVPIIGGEMEAGGVLSASDPDYPSWIVVKGISDFADGNRDKIIATSRPIACENSARFLLEALLSQPN